VKREVDTMLSSTKQSQRRVAAFTLLELMISVALVLVLMLGVNEVFRLTGETVGAGQALSGALRDERAAQQVMSQDFAAAAPDAPFFIIRSQVAAAFRSAEDKQSNVGLTNVFGSATDPNGNSYAANPAYHDVNGDNKVSAPGNPNYVPGEISSPAIPDSRMHRIDTVTFFVRRPLNRATGNISGFNGSAAQYSDLLGSTSTEEAMVTYGHLRVPNNQFNGGNGTNGTIASDYFFDPGEPDTSALVKNDNNQYATQWLLGRSQVTLVPRLTGNGSQNYPGETAFAPSLPMASSLQKLQGVGLSGLGQNDYPELGKLLTPLAMNTAITAYSTTQNPLDPGSTAYASSTLSTPGGTTVTPQPGRAAGQGPVGIWDSRLDLAVGSIASFNRQFAMYRAAVPDPVYTQGLTPGAPPWPWFLPAVSNHAPLSAAQTSVSWLSATGTNAAADHYILGGTGNNVPQPTFVYRSSAVPFAPRSGSSLGQTLAQTNPILLPRVTQFIVEYAGDFISQDENQYTPGNPTVLNPNYHNILPYPQGAQPDGNIDYVYFRGQKRIRWYGLPRYVGSGNIIPFSRNGYVGPVVQGTATPPSTASTVGQPTQLPVTVKSNGGYTTYNNNPNINNMPDVVPLSDILTAIGNGNGPYIAPTIGIGGTSRIAAPFERVVLAATPGSSNAPYTQENYANPVAPGGNGQLLTPANANYICAWAGGGPKMIRITITLEDANSKNLTGGKTFEYIFNLPY
jgi:type II secretory pathway pseudopilin PulG